MKPQNPRARPVVWLVARISYSDDADYILWAQASSRELLCLAPVAPCQSDPEALISTAAFTLRSAPKPDRVETDRLQFIASLESLGLSVKYCPHHRLIAEMADNLVMHLFDESYSYLRGGELRPDQVQRLAEAAFAYLDHPAEKRDEVVCLEGVEEKPVTVAVEGAASHELEITIYTSLEAANRRQSGLTIAIMDELDWPTDLDWEIAIHEWPAHNLGFPVFRGGDGQLRQPTAAQVERATRCFHALSQRQA